MKTFILREKTRWIFEIIAKPFIYFKVPPTVISFSSLLMTLLACYFVYKGNFYLVSIFIALNGLLDSIDGLVARRLGKDSELGHFTDNIMDKVCDALILTAFIIFGFVEMKLGIFTVVMMFLATSAAINIEAIFKIKFAQAFSTRFLRIFLLIVFVPFQNFNLMYWLIALLSTYTFFERIIKIVLYVKRDVKII